MPQVFPLRTTGKIVYTDGTRIDDIRSPNTTNNGFGSLPHQPSTSGPRSFPVALLSIPEPFVLFTRYEQDSNGDGQLDADDESSIWMQSWQTIQGQQF